MQVMALPVSFRWDEGFVARVDAARGDVPRSVFVRRAVERALAPFEDDPGWAERVKRRIAMTPEEVKRYGLNPPPEFYESPAPAEEPLSRAEMFKRATQG